MITRRWICFFVIVVCLFVCFCCTCVLGEICSFVVVSYLCCCLPICFVLLCALCFALLCFSLHLQNQFLSITLVPILIIPFSLSLSLSLSLSTFVSFFLLLQKFVFLCEFLGKDSCKVLFCKF
jgi:hypothetical protein